MDKSRVDFRIRWKTRLNGRGRSYSLYRTSEGAERLLVAAMTSRLMQRVGSFGRFFVPVAGEGPGANEMKVASGRPVAPGRRVEAASWEVQTPPRHLSRGPGWRRSARGLAGVRVGSGWPPLGFAPFAVRIESPEKEHPVDLGERPARVASRQAHDVADQSGGVLPGEAAADEQSV